MAPSPRRLPWLTLRRGAFIVLASLLLVGASCVALMLGELERNLEQLDRERAEAVEAGQRCGPRSGVLACLDHALDKLRPCASWSCVRATAAFANAAVPLAGDAAEVCPRLVHLGPAGLCEELAATFRWTPARRARCAPIGQRLLLPCVDAVERFESEALIVQVDKPCCALELGGGYGFRMPQAVCRVARARSDDRDQRRRRLPAWRSVLDKPQASAYAKMAAAFFLVRDDQAEQGAPAELLASMAQSPNQRHRASAVALIAQLERPDPWRDQALARSVAARLPELDRSLGAPLCEVNAEFPDGDQSDYLEHPMDEACRHLRALAQSGVDDAELQVALDICNGLASQEAQNRVPPSEAKRRVHGSRSQ
jgi:hypothetical protein